MQKMLLKSLSEYEHGDDEPEQIKVKSNDRAKATSGCAGSETSIFQSASLSRMPSTFFNVSVEKILEKGNRTRHAAWLCAVFQKKTCAQYVKFP